MIHTTNNQNPHRKDSSNTSSILNGSAERLITSFLIHKFSQTLHLSLSLSLCARISNWKNTKAEEGMQLPILCYSPVCTCYLLLHPNLDFSACVATPRVHRNPPWPLPESQSQSQLKHVEGLNLAWRELLLEDEVGVGTS